jgi:hypothetical protein
LQFFQGEIGGGFEGGVLAFMGGEFAEGAQKFVFVGERFFLELLKALGGGFFGTELFKFDAVVVPV